MQRKTSGATGYRLYIKPSATADTRTCDFKAVTLETLLESSEQHIRDVRTALRFFEGLLKIAGEQHDTDKITDIDGFHRDFVHGFDPDHQAWWDAHRRLNRHHLTQEDGVPDDVNLIDVLDFIADCVMAGMARSGSVYPPDLPDGLLKRAFDNTVAMLKAAVFVDREPADRV
jgi:hypothetical protein